MNLPLPQSKFGKKYAENFERIFGKGDKSQAGPSTCASEEDLDSTLPPQVFAETKPD